MKKHVIEIWSPKYSTNEVLVSVHRVKYGDNYIKFTKAPHLKNKLFLMDGKEIRKYPTQPNGKGAVYVVPLEDFKEQTQKYAYEFDPSTKIMKELTLF